MSHNFRALHVLKIVLKTCKAVIFFTTSRRSKDRNVGQKNPRLHRWTVNAELLQLQKWKDITHAAVWQTKSSISWTNTIIIISILRPRWFVSPVKEDQRRRRVWIPTGQTRQATRGKCWPNFKIPRRRGRRPLWELLGSKENRGKILYLRGDRDLTTLSGRSYCYTFNFLLLMYGEFDGLTARSVSLLGKHWSRV